MVERDDDKYFFAFLKTTRLLASPYPIFEADFSIDGVQVFADAMMLSRIEGKRAWRIIEVESSTSVKPYHRDDVAIQAFVARTAGVVLASIAVAHIDSSWVYPGRDDYRGLLVEKDLSDEAFGRKSEVKKNFRSKFYCN